MDKEKKNKEYGIRMTVDPELFELIMKQVSSMNEVCHGVLDIDFKPNNKIFREASKILARKFKGEV